MQKIILGSIAAIVITLGSALIATTLSPSQTSFAIKGNECSYVPEKYKHFDFSDACQRHDDCYAMRSISRYRCDRHFYNDMKKQCKTLDHGYLRCRIAARTYYTGVRAFGAPMYNRNSSSLIYRAHQLYVKYLERA